MAAGLGFKDFVTGEVLTAADVDGYLMQGIWVFASAAARDSAVTSPQEGNFAYLKDTNTTTYYTGSAWTNLDTTGMVNPMTTTGDTIYSSSGSTPARLGIGSTGQVLTVNSLATAPEWATPASGGMTLLSTTTLSGTSTTISSISGSYNDLYMVIKNVNNGTNNPIYINPNGSTSNTQFCIASTQLGGATSDQTRFKTHTNIKAGNTDNIFILHWVQYASASSVKSCYGSVGYVVDPSTYWAGTHGGTWFDNTAISSFTITSPTSLTGGTVLLYGVK